MNNLNHYSILFLILSMVFMIPLNSSLIYSAEGEITAKDRRSQVCGNFPPNPKESFILSVLTLCLPGILEKYHEYREFQCQEVVCTYNAIKNNLDPTVCSKIKDYQTCKYIVGEVFAITPLAIVEYWRSAIRNVIANPLGMAYSVLVESSRLMMYGSCKATNPPFLCDVSFSPSLNVAVPIVVVTDARAVYERLKDIFEGEGYLDSINPESSCEEVVEIKKELEEIIEAYENLN